MGEKKNFNECWNRIKDCPKIFNNQKRMQLLMQYQILKHNVQNDTNIPT